MQLLYPIGLLALAGLIIPVIIHLWSVKQGKTLKIGSISLLGESASATSKSFRLTDWLLFVLRCLILTLIAFILTQPFLKKKFNPSNNSGWILVQPNQFAVAYQNHKKSIDSLLNLGFELREFNFGFKNLNLSDTLHKPVDTNRISYTSLLKKLNTQIPIGYTAYVFADKQQINFTGDLPKTSFKLIWNESPINDTVKAWSTQFLGQNYEAKSSTNLTTYTAVSPQNSPVLTVAFYEPTGNDGKYIIAALKAIQDFTKRKIIIENYNEKSVAKADVIFWLSEKDFDPNLAKLKPNSKIFAYQKGKVVNVNSTLNLTTEEDAEIKLYKHIAANRQNGKVIWANGFGEPILLSETKNKSHYFYFYSRFNPQWTDLVWNEQFVVALMPVLFSEQSLIDFGFENHPSDQRLIASNQNITTPINQPNSTSAINKIKPLNQFLWVLVFMILLIERILSFRKTKLENVKS